MVKLEFGAFDGGEGKKGDDDAVLMEFFHELDGLFFGFVEADDEVDGDFSGVFVGGEEDEFFEGLEAAAFDFLEFLGIDGVDTKADLVRAGLE